MSSNERRRFLGRLAIASGAALLAGCDKLAANGSFRRLLALADRPTDLALQALTPDDALVREYTEADISVVFKANGSINPKTPEYLALVADDFANYRLKVGGLVETPLSLTLPELRAMPSRTQITRHDCVEGWSCIGKWKGTPLGVLAQARPTPDARLVVFHCADSLDNEPGRYY